MDRPVAPAHVEPKLAISDRYARPLAPVYEPIRRRTRLKILVVADGDVSLQEDQDHLAFGVGRLVRLLRDSTVGCTTFEVDTAHRNAVADGEPRYTGFRFDRRKDHASVLTQYDEVWCFGFNPGNDASPDDGHITRAAANPLSDSELRVLTEWMNKKRGGVLAMGDHHYLGASMCHRIPRVRSMRRWTNADGVPPRLGYDRLDTNQPATPGEQAGTSMIYFENQQDAVPQSIDWVPWITQQLHVLKISTRPHPILCHPTYGPIDVMPDHPHEGSLYEDHEISLAGTYDFDGLTGAEFPIVNGHQPAPMVIAHGTTTPDPPFVLEKHASPKKRFAMINAYDGHPAEVGRVVTDSTWHHWFDQNIHAIETAGGEDWAKISRYFLNVATWLAPPGGPDLCFAFEVLTTHFSYLGFQEYTRDAPVLVLGHPLHRHLSRALGPCWVTQWVLDQVRLRDDSFWSYLKDRLFWKRGIPWPQPPDPCLSCPPFELIEIAVLGGLVRATFDLADEIRQQVEAGAEKLDLDPDRLLEVQQTGIEIGLEELRRALTRSLEELSAALC